MQTDPKVLNFENILQSNPTGIEKGLTCVSTTRVQTFAIVDKNVNRLVFSHHMPRFEGFERFNADKSLLWAVHGAKSIAVANHCAWLDAKFTSRQSVPIVMNIGMLSTNAGSSYQFVDRKLFSESRFLIISRISASLRDDLHRQCLEWLEESNNPPGVELMGMKFNNLLQTKPMLVHQIMAKYPHLDIVIHPVLLAGGVKIQLATFRAKAADVKSLRGLNNNDIVVTL